MSETTTILGRAVAVVGGALLAMTLVTGIVGRVWRVMMWGTMHGMGSNTVGDPRMVPGPGLVFGSGIPLETAILWLLPLAVLFGLGYLVFKVVTRTAEDPLRAELREAHARGDLDDEEYEYRRDRLTRSRAAK